MINWSTSTSAAVRMLFVIAIGTSGMAGARNARRGHNS
jgi:hypothetical protein